jgi:hypothetical protein
LANNPSDVGPDEIVPEEIQLEVSDQMIQWDECLKQYHKALQNETVYTETKGQDVDDEEAQAFFDQKIARAVAQQKEAQENAMCINSAVRQTVTSMCVKHNDALAAKSSRKRKASQKEVVGSSAQVHEPKKRAKKDSTKTKTVVAASARQVSPRQQTPPHAPTPPRAPSPPPAAATEHSARVEQENVARTSVPPQDAPKDVPRKDFSPAVSVREEEEDVDIVTRSRESAPILRIEGHQTEEQVGSSSSSGSSSGSSSSSSEEEVSDGNQADMTSQLIADLVDMENDEEDHNENPVQDTVMIEQEIVAAQNAPPPSGQAEVVARQEPAVTREEIAHDDIIHVPRPPPKVNTVAGPSGLNANNDMPVDELLNSRHPREMMPLFQPDIPRGGPRFVHRDHKQSFFETIRPNPYTLPRTSVSLRFWTQEQAIYYAQVLLNKDKLFDHSYLDMPSFYSVVAFQNISQIIDEMQAHRVFALPNGYNPELIKQFFSTLYVSGHHNQMESWQFNYMIQGQVFHLTVDQFLEIINLPRFEGLPAKIHSLPNLTPDEFSVVMKPEAISDGYPPAPMPKHLVFEAKAWFYILAKTLIPMKDVHDDYPIPSLVQHAIVKLFHGIPFDFEDCFLRILIPRADTPFARKPYAPWLMAVCNFSRDEPFPDSRHLKLFLPPVRPVLEIASRPNDPFAEYVGSQKDVNERNMSKQFVKPVNHMEVSLRTQQMLKHFIDEDRVQKQFILNEINRVRNIAYNNNQIGRESLRREWKGLRKFNTPGQLERAGFEAHPQHLQRPWAQPNHPDRPDQILPRLQVNREICSVDRYYNIAIQEAYTDGDGFPAQDQRSRSPGQAPADSTGDAMSFPRHSARRQRSPSAQASQAGSSRGRRSRQE